MARVLTKHRKGCRAVGYVEDGTWSTPWFLRTEHVWRDRIGKKQSRAPLGGNHRWLVATCNTNDCPARAIVSEDEVLTKLLPLAKHEKEGG